MLPPGASRRCRRWLPARRYRRCPLPACRRCRSQPAITAGAALPRRRALAAGGSAAAGPAGTGISAIAGAVVDAPKSSAKPLPGPMLPPLPPLAPVPPGPAVTGVSAVTGAILAGLPLLMPMLAAGAAVASAGGPPAPPFPRCRRDRFCRRHSVAVEGADAAAVAAVLVGSARGAIAGVDDTQFRWRR